MAGEYLQAYTFEYILAQALAQVPNTVDKREGSVIYDALAPACYELAEFYMKLKQIVDQTYVLTSTESYLDYRAAEAGLTRYAATHAVRKATFLDGSGAPMSVPIGTRLSTVEDANSINYEVTVQYEVDGVPVDGEYELMCETIGSIGNVYTGQLIPIDYVSGLASATISDTIIPARDEETDDELRARYILKVTKKPFGGNIAQYDELMKEQSGVGDVQVYPVWDGGGTVKISVVDAQYSAPDPAFITSLQNIIDPTGDATGIGLAPIGHIVTVVAPTEVSIAISATITLKSGYTIGQVQPLVETALESYMLSLRQQWGVADEHNDYAVDIYLAQVSAIILGVTGIANVTNVQLNGSALDTAMTETSTTQELPVLGVVTLSE